MWGDLQSNASMYLLDGVDVILASDILPVSDLKEKPGNYLFSVSDHNYTGESKRIRSRIKSHFSFSGTFNKKLSQYQLSVDQSTIQVDYTCLGRKELEECLIQAVPCDLNKAAKGREFHFSDYRESWRLLQSKYQEYLEAGYQALMQSDKIPWFDLEPPIYPGVYVVYHPNHGMVYVGESYKLEERLSTHVKDTYFSALRRNIGRDIFGYSLHSKNGKNKYFNPSEDFMVTSFIEACSISVMPVRLGRKELEEYVVAQNPNVLNRK